MNRVLRVFVPGIARPQGSMRSVMTHGRVRTFHGNHDELIAWRGGITAAAADLWGDTPPLDEAVVLVVAFWLPRPVSAPKRRVRPDRLPDIDKLARAVADALTGIVYVDDARIVSLFASKHYAVDHQIGVHIMCGPETTLGPGVSAWEGTGRVPDDVSPCAVGNHDPHHAGAGNP